MGDYTVKSTSNVSLTWSFADIEKKYSPEDIRSRTYEIAPMYMLNNPNECVRSAGWKVDGNLDSTRGTLDLNIPLTTQNMTACYVLVKIETASVLYTGIKPLIVYGLTNITKIS